MLFLREGLALQRPRAPQHHLAAVTIGGQSVGCYLNNAYAPFTRRVAGFAAVLLRETPSPRSPPACAGRVRRAP
jgi:hypothetical protein